jgi:hypothetical protein
MRIEMVEAVIDEGNGEAPLTYIVDGVRKQIAWSALSALFVDRYWKEDQQQTEEQKLLAQIVSENWKDADDWWVGACACSDSGTVAAGSAPSVDSPQDKEEQ